jgi:hypothetical protein
MFDRTEEDIALAPIIPVSSRNCTVISLVPFAIKEVKPQIIPGYFQIPPCKDGDIQCLPVGESIHWMESPFHKMPPIKLTETSVAIARSIVNDYIEAQLATDTDVSPGLFWVEGHYSKERAKEELRDKISLMRERQKRWFINLVKIADDDWAQSHQHKFISDVQRHAARALGMRDREWLTIVLESEMVQCPMCKEYVRPDAIIHSACGFIIRPSEYAVLKDRLIPKSAMEQLKSIGVE